MNLMKVANNWKDYEILDMANGEKLVGVARHGL